LKIHYSYLNNKDNWKLLENISNKRWGFWARCAEIENISKDFLINFKHKSGHIEYTIYQIELKNKLKCKYYENS
jgi:hypothetical protein